MANIRKCSVNVPAWGSVVVETHATSVHEGAAKGIAHLTSKDWLQRAGPDTEIRVSVEYTMTLKTLEQWIETVPEERRPQLRALLQRSR